jgi:TRAP-type mannitol/chloroaromatic compound transport system permease small subunit
MKMNDIKTVRYLWVSIIGSSLFALPSAIVLIFELYFYFNKNWFVFWHKDSANPVGLLAMAIVWLSFPAIYVWTIRSCNIFERKKLLIIGGITNILSIILPLLGTVMFFALETKGIS